MYGNGTTAIEADGADTMYGGAGDHFEQGDFGGPDLQYGGLGDDILPASGGASKVYGGPGVDILAISHGDDVELYGNSGMVILGYGVNGGKNAHIFPVAGEQDQIFCDVANETVEADEVDVFTDPWNGQDTRAKCDTINVH